MTTLNDRVSGWIVHLLELFRDWRGAPAGAPESGMIRCARCKHDHRLMDRRICLRFDGQPSPTVCPACGCEGYFKLDIHGRRIR